MKVNESLVWCVRVCFLVPSFCLIYDIKVKKLIDSSKFAVVNGGDVTVSENPSAADNLPMDGAEWVNLFVREMMSATSPHDARARASRVLELLEKSISARAGAEAAQAFQKVNILFAHVHLFFA